MKVFVMDIHHKHGNDISVFTTDEKRTEALYEYVSQWWDDWMFDDKGKVIDITRYPKEEAIERYFDEHAEFNTYPEYVDYEEAEVQ